MVPESASNDTSQVEAIATTRSDLEFLLEPVSAHRAFFEPLYQLQQPAAKPIEPRQRPQQPDHGRQLSTNPSSDESGRRDGQRFGGSFGKLRD